MYIFLFFYTSSSKYPSSLHFIMHLCKTTQSGEGCGHLGVNRTISNQDKHYNVFFVHYMDTSTSNCYRTYQALPKTILTQDNPTSILIPNIKNPKKSYFKTKRFFVIWSQEESKYKINFKRL